MCRLILAILASAFVVRVLPLRKALLVIMMMKTMTAATPVLDTQSTELRENLRDFFDTLLMLAPTTLSEAFAQNLFDIFIYVKNKFLGCAVFDKLTFQANAC